MHQQNFHISRREWVVINSKNTYHKREGKKVGDSDHGGTSKKAATTMSMMIAIAGEVNKAKTMSMTMKKVHGKK